MPNIPIISRLLKIVTSLAILFIVVDASKQVFQGGRIKSNTDITISAKPIEHNELPQLKWKSKNNETVNIESTAKNQWIYKLNDDPITLLESDGYELIQLSNSIEHKSKVQKHWWHSIFSNKGGYINNQSHVKSIVIKSVNQNNYWWIWFFISFAVTMIFIKKYKK